MNRAMMLFTLDGWKKFGEKLGYHVRLTYERREEDINGTGI
jgi:hypothetical protein